MVAGFSRSFSFSGPPRPKPAPRKSYHVRSVSLPCRSHPLISTVEDEIRSVRAWQSSQPEPAPASASASSWICDGLTRLELLHASLNEFLNLPQNQGSLRRGSASEWTGRVLENFLRLADAHGSFRSDTMALHEHLSDAQVAIRRRDAVELASRSRSMKKTEKELVKLASSLREISKSSPAAAGLANGIEEAELAGIIRDVVNVTVTASTAVFLAVAAVSAAVLAAKSSWTPLRRVSSSKSFRINVGEEGAERLRMLEECVRDVECRSEKLFRCLINTRVSLLNILTSN